MIATPPPQAPPTFENFHDPLIRNSWKPNSICKHAASGRRELVSAGVLTAIYTTGVVCPLYSVTAHPEVQECARACVCVCYTSAGEVCWLVSLTVWMPLSPLPRPLTQSQCYEALITVSLMWTTLLSAVGRLDRDGRTAPLTARCPWGTLG